MKNRFHPKNMSKWSGWKVDDWNDINDLDSL
jgi:hypothetical protein